MSLDIDDSAFEVNKYIPITYENIIDGICHNSYDEIIEFIKILDETISDNEFTKMLGQLVMELFKEMDTDEE